MFSAINQLLKDFIEGDSNKSKPAISLEVACTVLLFEVIKADGIIKDEEHQKILDLTRQQFQLSAEEVKQITEQALEESNNAIDFFQFTKKINQHYSIEQRIEIVNKLWKIAYADGELSPIEEHTIRRIADLLHLKHSEFISTKPLLDHLSPS